MSNLDYVKVSECEACNIRSEKVNSDNPYWTPLCPKCVHVWDSESEDEDEDDGLVTCEACEARVDALYTVWDMYSVCKNCIDNYDVANEDIS